MNETSFLLVYRTEAIIPIRIIAPTLKATFNEFDYNSKRSLGLVLVKEL